MKFIWIVLTLPLVFFLPGYSILKSRLFRRSSLSGLEAVMLSVGLSAGIASCVSLFLAEVGFFRLWLVNLFLAVVTIFFLGFYREPEAGGGSRPGGLSRKEAAAILLLIVLCAPAFFRPAEYVVGEGDPEYYFNIGNQLARSGSMNVRDPAVTRMNDFEISTFFNKGVVQFLPFHLRDRKSGRIQPLLYHLLPVWIAVFVKIFGTRGGLFVVPVFSLLGVLSAFALSRRFTRCLASSFTAALLFAVSFLQIWFARIPVTETFTQPFILLGVLAYADFRESPSYGSALACTVLMTAAATARPEAAVILALLLFILVLGLLTREMGKEDLILSNGLLVGALCVLLYVRFCELEYVSANFGRIIRFFGERTTLVSLVKISAALAGFLIILFNLRFLNRLIAARSKVFAKKLVGHREIGARLLRGVLSVATVLPFLYLYFSQRAKSANMAAHRIFYNTAAFFGDIAVFVFVFSLGYFLYEMEDVALCFLLSLSTVAFLLSSQEPTLALGLFPWDSRRLLLFVIPLLFVGGSYALAKAWSSSDAAKKTVASAVALAFLVFFAIQSAGIFTHVEYGGGIGSVERLSKRLNKSVVLFTGYYTGEVIGIPLRYTFGVDSRRVYRMDDPWGFAEIVKRLLDGGKRVYLEPSGIEAKEIPYNGRVKKLVDFGKRFEEILRFKRLEPVQWGIPRRKFVQKISLRFIELKPTRYFIERVERAPSG